VPIHNEENHLELIAARAGGEQHDIRWDEWRGEERLFVAAPVTEENRKVIGFVQLSILTTPIYDGIRGTWLSLFAAGGSVLLATALVSLVLARQIARPVQSLTAITEEIAAGHLEQRVTPAGPDEIQRLGRAFNRMAERVREMLAQQQAFAANAAHELRSPLTSLRLRLEMLQTHGQGNGELAHRYLAQMEREVDHLRRLVDHLLALSTLDEGKRLLCTALDPAPLLYELADEMGPLAQEAGLDLCVDVPPHLPPLMANGEQMRIVVRNLLDNAIKYTPAGGMVTLSAWADNGRVQIAVTDTGVGIPAEALPHIFERFYRVDKARSRRQGGAGLGLALVRSIVEAQGGQVEVKSQPGAGSVFTLSLPANCRS
jgi:two-component system sensor histidine kinase BaeS